jgi:probable phosphoglycerate mutase
VQLSELREKDFGTGEGTRMGSKQHKGAETPEAMRLRVDRFLDGHLFPLADDSVICVVAHGIILGVLFKALSARTSVAIAHPARTELFPDASSLSRLWWSNTGYLEAVMQKPGLKLSIERINSMDHVKGLKKTRGGIGSAKFDDKQKTMDSFFQPASKRRKREW